MFFQMVSCQNSLSGSCDCPVIMFGAEGVSLLAMPKQTISVAVLLDETMVIY